jgi:hypothetical protein
MNNLSMKTLYCLAYQWAQAQENGDETSPELKYRAKAVIDFLAFVREHKPNKGSRKRSHPERNIITPDRSIIQRRVARKGV